MWLISEDDAFLKKSRNLYFQAFKKSSGYYSGINAASLSLIIGDTETAGRLATIVLKICLDLIKTPENRDYWCLATIGEAFIVLGRYSDAAKYLGHAKKVGGKNYSYLASTKKQLVLLSRFVDIPPEVGEILSIPPVIAFTGHMIDSPDRKTPRFPPGLEQAVRDEISKRIEKLDAGIGFSSGACGSDILFLETMQERKAETNIVLPFELDDFYATSVTFAGEKWKDRLDDVLVRASSVLFATEGKYAGDDLLFDYTNRILMGKAIIKAEILQTSPVLLCVWNSKKSAKQGGTAGLIDVWRRKKLQMEIVDINGLKETATAAAVQTAVTTATAVTTPPARKPPVKTKVKRAVKAMLFADIVGFSMLKEEQYPAYIDDYLGSLADNLKRSGYKPLFKNIWGDALYIVFEDLLQAAHYALELRDFVTNTDWSRSGLPSDLNIRIGLHAGPVFCAREPILGRTNYFGNHVNRAARIEPITNPGNVYASEQFASLLLAQPSGDIECKYVGIIVLPKRFGNYPIYHLKRRNEIQ